MNNLQKYVSEFLEEVEIFEDVARGHHYKVFISGAVADFFANETKETALRVYRAFLDAYRIRMEDGNDSFIDLFDVLRSYEENAAVLLSEQRDHYVHSVNVFLTGLAIYARNANYRAVFDGTVLDKKAYPYSYDTRHEEFFYRWGIASLFHDVGYPVEIIARQLSDYIDFAADADGSETKVNAHLEFDRFDELNCIKEIARKRDFTQCLYDACEETVYIDPLKPIDLMALRLHLAFGIDLYTIKKALDGYVATMAQSGYVDHGFYSSLILLKWYGYVIQRCGYRSEYFFWPIVDSASAILLHNFYRNNMTVDKHFALGPMEPARHPIAYLLILCDELQEWNREAYGTKTRSMSLPEEASIVISDIRLDVTYIVKKGTLKTTFSAEKEDYLRYVLDMGDLFPNGFSIGCHATESFDPRSGLLRKETPMPRPFIENIERLAIAVHEDYNQKQLTRYPDKPLDYPSFERLPDDMKYSNFRQAYDIVDKLNAIGCAMVPESAEGEAVLSFDIDTVEFLAAREHEAFVDERVRKGWTYGAVKDTKRKLSPYLVPYDQLEEKVKENDRDSIRNIPNLLGLIGMKAIKKI